MNNNGSEAPVGRFAVLPPEASVTCAVAAPRTRGSYVDCECRLLVPCRYTVTRYLSTDSAGVGIVDSTFMEERAKGEAHTWPGIALTKTSVTIAARVATSRTSRTVVASGSFDVLSRMGMEEPWISREFKLPDHV